MTHDDLEKPMGLRTARPARRLLPRFDVVTGIAALAGAVLAFGGVWALVVTDPFGGEPVANAAIERRMPAAPSTAPDTQAAHGGSQAARDGAPPSSRDGVPIVRPGDPMPKAGPVIIQIPGADTAPGASATVAPGVVDKALLEDSRYGPLPRIGADGRRPMDAYARPSPKPVANVARVALVVGGLGVSRDATLEALRVLPPEVSLAFSPYAADIGDLVAKARAGGREALIQAPMEPFDYPANDPGPQTLLTSLPASANLERLRWSLGRTSGYVGVAPLAGARFLENGDALQPMFAELARRGLMFVGSASRNDPASPIAERAALPHAKASIAIDAAPDAVSIDAALARLENEAKAGGVSIGWAGASPLTLKRIEAWRAGLAARGIALVPVSAAVGPQGKS